jgi:hypothetical protein
MVEHIVEKGFRGVVRHEVLAQGFGKLTGNMGLSASVPSDEENHASRVVRSDASNRSSVSVFHP